MGEFSLAHILVVAVVAIVLFGRGKVGALMGEFGRGISAFKKGVAEGNDAAPNALSAPAADPAEKRADA